MSELEELRALKVRVEALAESMTWKRPEKSPCGDPEACCGSEESCDAMHPSTKVVGVDTIRALLASLDAYRDFQETADRVSAVMSASHGDTDG